MASHAIKWKGSQSRPIPQDIHLPGAGFELMHWWNAFVNVHKTLLLPLRDPAFESYNFLEQILTEVFHSQSWPKFNIQSNVQCYYCKTISLQSVRWSLRLFIVSSPLVLIPKGHLRHVTCTKMAHGGFESKILVRRKSVKGSPDSFNKFKIESKKCM